MRLFVHGAGRSGPEAWPNASREGANFASFAPGATVAEQVDHLAAIAPTMPSVSITVVAHSLGAVAAVLASANGAVRADRLVLIEPALYDVARGNPAIERHIEMMTRARSLAAAGDLVGYWRIVRPLMFGGAADPTRWDEERSRAEWFASVPSPWGHGVATEAITSTPTLVVTGGWKPSRIGRNRGPPMPRKAGAVIAGCWLANDGTAADDRLTQALVLSDMTAHVERATRQGPSTTRPARHGRA
jgi:pimeloyl-ACP methyl ester carboxylesterase